MNIKGCLIGYTGKSLIGKFMGEDVIITCDLQSLEEQLTLEEASQLYCLKSKSSDGMCSCKAPNLGFVPNETICHRCSLPILEKKPRITKEFADELINLIKNS